MRPGRTYVSVGPLRPGGRRGRRAPRAGGLADGRCAAPRRACGGPGGGGGGGGGGGRGGGAARGAAEALRSAASVDRVLDPEVTGLPAQLARTPGPDTGLVTVHKRAAGEVHAMRRLAMATPVGLIETSGGHEDVQSFGWEAAEALRAALRHARVVTACELLAGWQAIALSGLPAPPGC